LKHNGHAEVILPGRILNLVNRKERSPNGVLVKYYAGARVSQMVGKGTFSRSGKTRHSDQHAQFLSTMA
jgi:hypothetical protein